MIQKIRIDGELSAKDVIDQLTKNFSWRFKKILDGEAYMIHVFFNDVGFEYTRTVYFRASKDNRHILIYVNKKDFPRFYRDECNDQVFYDFTGYLDQVIPHNWECVR